MRRAWLVLLLLMVPATLAAQQPPAAPKPGHPLDPADVATLSAKPHATPYSTYASPYWGNPYGTWYGDSAFAPVSTETSPPITPLVFGRIGDRPVVLFTTRNAGVPPLVFGRGGSFFLGSPRQVLFGTLGR